MTPTWHALPAGTSRNVSDPLPEGTEFTGRHGEPVGKQTEISQTWTFPLAGYFLG